MAFRLEIIIHGVMARPYIFNKFDKGYQDVHKRQRGFDEIAGEVNSFMILVDENAELLTGKTIESLWNQLLIDYKEARKQMNSQRSGDGLKINHFQFMGEMSFMDPYLEQRPVLSSLNPTKNLKRKRVLQVPQSTLKKNTSEKDMAIQRINAQMEDILYAVKANLCASGTPADPINSTQSLTTAPGYYPFNSALPSTSGEPASASSHPLNRAVPSTSSTAAPAYYSYNPALPSTSRQAALASSHPLNHAVPSTSSTAAPAYYSYNPALPSTSRQAALAYSHPMNRAVPSTNSTAAPANYSYNPALPSTSRQAALAYSHPMNLAVPPSSTYLHAGPSTSSNSAVISSSTDNFDVTSASTTNDTVELDVSITNNSSISSGYTNILWEAFQKVPAGEKLNCFKYVLKDFLQFRKTLKNN